MTNINLNTYFARHTKIAFQFSGGKDSTALLLSMRPYWPQMTIYHLDTCDEHPELAATVEKMANLVPVIMIRSDVMNTKRKYGLPSDVVPWSSAYAAHACNAGTTPLTQDRVHCCYRTIMEPLHARMKQDGITLIIRGQKKADEFKGRLDSGDVVDGIEFLYPFEDMTDADCFDVLQEHGFNIPSYYADKVPHTSDCLTCTAWVVEDRGSYLKKNYPEKYDVFRNNILTIAAAVQPAARALFTAADKCLEQ